LLASGLIVGESLRAVVFAGIVGLSGAQSPIAVGGQAFEPAAIILGGVVFAVTVVVLYRWIMKMGRATA
jgi:hypothetical protein